MPTNQVNQKILLADLLLKYAGEISPAHKGIVSETYRLNSAARRWIGKLDIRYLNKHQFIQYRDDRLLGHFGWSSISQNLRIYSQVHAQLH